MRHLLLISNSTSFGSGYLDHCVEIIRNFLGNQVCKVVFIPYALHDWESYTARVRERFKKMGYETNGIHESANQRKAVEQAQAFFVGGGNTFRLLKTLYDLDLMGLIRTRVLAGIPYVGTSAGSNIACASIGTTNDMPIVYPPTFEALNLVPYNLNPHYTEPDPDVTHMGETREQRIKEFLEENANAVVGLREDGILRVDNNTMILRGAGAKIFLPNGETKEYVPGADLSFLL